MIEEAFKVLLVEDNFEYANVLQMILNWEPPNLFQITHAKQLYQALSYLARGKYDIILLDLSLPDSDGYDTFARVHAQAPSVPIVVLTSQDDETLALRAAKEGAQDFLIKGSVEGHLLVRALRYAIERQRALSELQHLSLVDDLTGLLNRRGFISLANQHLKIAKRANRKLLLFFTDMDDLKKINDQFGHPEGDNALRTMAAIFKSTFRSSDIICRLGGDEFVILAVDADCNSESILKRLQENINRHNRANSRYTISLSVGIAQFNPEHDTTLDHLLTEADKALYADKQRKH